MEEAAYQNAVVVFFEGLCPVWTAEPVKVELVPFDRTAPTTGTVGRDKGGGFCILAADILQGRTLMWVCFHELRHIVRGDKMCDPDILAVDRQIMMGQRSWATEVRRKSLEKYEREREGNLRESECDEFANQQTDRFWPIMQDIIRNVDAAWTERIGGVK